MKLVTRKETTFSFKNTLLMAGILLAMSSQSVSAEERTIDVSGNNTSSSYKTYNTAFSLPAGDIVNVKMARYCYFSSTITGKGVLNLYAGGERCYLGTAKAQHGLIGQTIQAISISILIKRILRR